MSASTAEAIPRIGLVATAVVPLGIAVALALYAFVADDTNPHGPFGGGLMLLFAAVCIGAVAELVLVSLAVLRLARARALRTPANIVPIAVGVAFLCLVAGGVGYLALAGQVAA